MARERDELDRTRSETDEDIRDREEDEFEDAEETDEEDLEDVEAFEDDRLTGEVGSEGGSPGERVRTRKEGERLRGSEATETAEEEE